MHSAARPAKNSKPCPSGPRKSTLKSTTKPTPPAMSDLHESTTIDPPRTKRPKNAADQSRADSASLLLDTIHVRLPVPGVIIREHGAHPFVPGDGQCVAISQVSSAGYAPRPVRPARVENISGFVQCVDAPVAMDQLAVPGRKCFGSHLEIHHLHGVLYLYPSARIFFKGCKGVAALERIAASLHLPQLASEPDVHMAVFTARLGHCVDTASGQYMRHLVRVRFPALVFMPHGVDNHIALHVKAPAFQLHDMPWIEPAFQPADMDVTVSGRGAVLVRMSWTTPIRWTPRAEAAALGLCEGLAQALRECS